MMWNVSMLFVLLAGLAFFATVVLIDIAAVRKTRPQWALWIGGFLASLLFSAVGFTGLLYIGSRSLLSRVQKEYHMLPSSREVLRTGARIGGAHTMESLQGLIEGIQEAWRKKALTDLNALILQDVRHPEKRSEGQDRTEWQAELWLKNPTETPVDLETILQANLIGVVDSRHSWYPARPGSTETDLTLPPQTIRRVPLRFDLPADVQEARLVISGLPVEKPSPHAPAETENANSR